MVFWMLVLVMAGIGTGYAVVRRRRKTDAKTA
jgi:hypothetical protein